MSDEIPSPEELAKEFLKDFGIAELAVRAVERVSMYYPKWPPTSLISYGFQSGYWDAVVMEIRKQPQSNQHKLMFVNIATEQKLTMEYIYEGALQHKVTPDELLDEMIQSIKESK
jgi:hypothetical protein